MSSTITVLAIKHGSVKGEYDVGGISSFSKIEKDFEQYFGCQFSDVIPHAYKSRKSRLEPLHSEEFLKICPEDYQKKFHEQNKRYLEGVKTLMAGGKDLSLYWEDFKHPGLPGSKKEDFSEKDLQSPHVFYQVNLDKFARVIERQTKLKELVIEKYAKSIVRQPNGEFEFSFESMAGDWTAQIISAIINGGILFIGTW